MFALGESEYSVEYRIANREKQAVEVWFGIEFAVGAMAGDAPDRYY